MFLQTYQKMTRTWHDMTTKYDQLATGKVGGWGMRRRGNNNNNDNDNDNNGHLVRLTYNT